MLVNELAKIVQCVEALLYSSQVRSLMILQVGMPAVPGFASSRALGRVSVHVSPSDGFYPVITLTPTSGQLNLDYERKKVRATVSSHPQ